MPLCRGSRLRLERDDANARGQIHHAARDDRRDFLNDLNELAGLSTAGTDVPGSGRSRYDHACVIGATP